MKIAVRASLAMLALTGLAAPARAGWEDYRFTADLVLDARASDGAAGTIDAGPSLRATAGHPLLAYAVGLEARPGGGRHGGFAFGAALYPVGLAIGAGAPVSLRVVGGVGTDGVTGHLPFTARFPIEASLELHPVRALELTVYGELAWVTAASRADGARDLDVDELRLGAALRVGRGRAERQRWHWSNGWRLGVQLQERVGERAWGLTFGYGIDMAAGPMRLPG